MINEYLKYKRQREKIKARQRDELERELIPQAIDLGRAIHEAKHDGKKITEIAFTLGLKNRTFIYKMLNTYLTSKVEVGVEPEPEFTAEPEEAGIITFSKDRRRALVSFGDLGTVTVGLDAEGNVVDMPDEWLTGTKEERKAYAAIIKDIESHGVTENQ